MKNLIDIYLYSYHKRISIITNLNKTSSIAFACFIIVLINIAYNANAQGTNLATSDVHNASPYESLSTDWSVLGDPKDSALVDSDSYMIFRANGTFDVRNKDTNEIETQKNTGLDKGAWVAKVGENTYYAGNGLSIMQFNFDPTTNALSSIIEKYQILWMGGDQRAGDYSPTLGLGFFDDGNFVYRVNPESGAHTALFGGGYDMIKIIEFNDGAYLNKYMLQLDGEQFLNLDNLGNVIGSVVIPDFNNFSQILDMEYFGDKAIAIEKKLNQNYTPFDYQKNMNLDPTGAVPEPSVVGLFLFGLGILRKIGKTYGKDK